MITNKHLIKKYPVIEGYDNAYIKESELTKSHLMKRYSNRMVTIDNKYYDDEQVKVKFVLKNKKILSDYLIGRYYRGNDLDYDLCGETIGTYILRHNIQYTLDYIVIIKEGRNSKLNKSWTDIIIYTYKHTIITNYIQQEGR